MTKKHIDWKRIGWTLLIIGGIAGATSLHYFWWAKENDNLFVALAGSFAIGLFSLAILVGVIGFMILPLITLILEIPHFYYHNGEEKK